MASKNIIVFGQSGAGKSSLINMMIGQEVARVSESAIGCTLTHQSYHSEEYTYFDTAGLDEGSQGAVSAVDAVANLIQLMKSLKDGVGLLMYVIRKGRITDTTERNYELFAKAICMSKVPVILIITHCESEAETGDWWKNERHHFIEKYKMTFHDVISACTKPGIPGQSLSDVIAVLNSRYADTKMKVANAVRVHCLEQPWVMKNWSTWLKEVLGTVMGVIASVVSFAQNPQDAIKAKLIEFGVSAADAVQITVTLKDVVEYVKGNLLKK